MSSKSISPMTSSSLLWTLVLHSAALHMHSRKVENQTWYPFWIGLVRTSSTNKKQTFLTMSLGLALKQPKIPTVICYDPDDKNQFTWGAQKHKTDTVAGVKLLLDPDQPRPLYLPESTAKADLKRLGKPAVEVA